MVTLTMRHTRKMSLEQLWAAKSRAWRAVHNGRGYAADAERAGIVGWATGTEVTHGKNGWHVHIHCLLFCDKFNSDDVLDSVGVRAFERWACSLESAGLPRPSAKHGVDVRAVQNDRDAREIGSYVVKGIASESALGQFKEGRAGNLSPFELLDRAGEGDARALSLWREWEEASRGRRQMAWSRGFKQELAVSEQSDQEIVNSDVDGEFVGSIRVEAWKKVAKNVGFRQALLVAVQGASSACAAHRAAKRVAIEYGVELLPPPRGESPPTR